MTGAGVDFDQKTKTKKIYRFVGPGHKGWSRNVDDELGNYDFLMGNDVRTLCAMRLLRDIYPQLPLD